MKGVWYNTLMKEKIIVALRWVGAAVLPIPVAMVLHLSALFVAPFGIGRFIESTNLWWRIFSQYVLFGIDGFVMAICSYILAPRSKFFTMTVIATVYITINATGILLWVADGQFAFPTLVKYLACPLGLGYGIFYIHCKEQEM